MIDQLYAALAPRLPMIAKRFAGDAYAYRAGWPDITAIRDGEVLFREVKTTDKLHRSQLETISCVLLPEELNVDVLQIVPAGPGHLPGMSRGY